MTSSRDTAFAYNEWHDIIISVVKLSSGKLMSLYSLDLRRKIVEAYEKGDTSIRKVAKQFSISPETVRRLLNLYRSTGSLSPKKCGTKRVSILSQHEEAILEIVETNPDFTLREYCEEVQEKLGVSSNTSMMHRFLKQHDISLKKNLQERENNHGRSASRACRLLAANFEGGS